MGIDLVVVAGIKRSASTACFNIVRLALQMAGHKVNIYGQDYKLREVPEGEVDLCKIHPFRKELAKEADHIFLTDRNDEDILKSLDRMWGSGDPERLEGMRKDLEAWKEYTDFYHCFEYKTFERDKGMWAMGILSALDLHDKVEFKELLDEFNKIEPPQSGGIDPVTRLFPKHIS